MFGIRGAGDVEATRLVELANMVLLASLPDTFDISSSSVFLGGVLEGAQEA